MPSWNEKNHVRQNSRCRLHGLEQRYPPPAQGGERVSRTTENLVKIQCGGVAVGDTATWHRLIEKFVPVETTWLSRPLLLQKGEGGGEDDTFFDVSLGRNYTSAEGDQVARELREAREMDSLQTKARAVLELYRRRGRHPRKLIMNLAYDPFSALMGGSTGPLGGTGCGTTGTAQSPDSARLLERGGGHQGSHTTSAKFTTNGRGSILPQH